MNRQYDEQPNKVKNFNRTRSLIRTKGPNRMKCPNRQIVPATWMFLAGQMVPNWSNVSIPKNPEYKHFRAWFGEHIFGWNWIRRAFWDNVYVSRLWNLLLNQRNIDIRQKRTFLQQKSPLSRFKTYKAILITFLSYVHDSFTCFRKT